MVVAARDASEGSVHNVDKLVDKSVRDVSCGGETSGEVVMEVDLVKAW